jgi:vacuolar-type H+-ATPase subunit H
VSALAWRALGVLAIVVALIAGYTALIHHERGVGYDQCVSEAKDKENAELQAAREETTRLFALYDKAQQEGAEREKNLVRQRDRADAAADGLRDTLADVRGRLPQLAAEACRAYADAGLRLLGECQGRYRAVAERAAGHLNDWQTLDQGWPQ